MDRCRKRAAGRGGRSETRSLSGPERAASGPDVAWAMVRSVRDLAFGMVLLVGTSWTGLSLAQEAAPEEKPAAPSTEAADAKPQTAAEQAEATKAEQEKDKQAAAASTESTAAPEKAPNPEDAKAPGEDDDFGHGGQFGIRVGLVGGYRMVFRYDKSPYCSKPDVTKLPKDQQKFCGHGGPLAIDIGLSFAPLDGIEPFLWGRFGLSGESETNTQALVMVGAGARIYTMSDSKFKIFIEPAVAAELEKGAGNALWNYGNLNPEYKTDLVFHLAAGPQFDVAKAFGFYLDAGVTTGVLRAIHSTLELQGGVQLRVP